jgi:hypothetical protein
MCKLDIDSLYNDRGRDEKKLKCESIWAHI